MPAWPLPPHRAAWSVHNCQECEKRWRTEGVPNSDREWKPVIFPVQKVRFPAGLWACSAIIALLRCVIPEQETPLGSVPPFCAETSRNAEDQQCATLPDTPGNSPGCGPSSTFLINNAHRCPAWSTPIGWPEGIPTLRNITVTIGIYRRVTRCLSDLSTLFSRKSGVFYAQSVPPSFTPLGEWRPLFSPTQGIFPSWAQERVTAALPGPLGSGVHERGVAEDRGIPGVVYMPSMHGIVWPPCLPGWYVQVYTSLLLPYPGVYTSLLLPYPGCTSSPLCTYPGVY